MYLPLVGVTNIFGDVIHQTSGASLEVSGDVKNTAGGSVRADKTAVQGDVTSSGAGSAAAKS